MRKAGISVHESAQRMLPEPERLGHKLARSGPAGVALNKQLKVHAEIDSMDLIREMIHREDGAAFMQVSMFKEDGIHPRRSSCPKCSACNCIGSWCLQPART